MEFPSKLCSTNIQPFLVVRGNEVTNRSLHSASITANVPIPIEAKCYYYEITARNVEKGSICFGLIPEHQFLTEALLGKKHGYGLRSDGRLFSHLNPSGIDWSFSSGWGNIVGDTVGCGIFFDTGEIFFTKGKKCCGVAFTLPPDVLKKVQSSVSVEPLKSSNTASSKVSKSKCRQLIPCVTVGANRKVSVNFGNELPFEFDIAGYIMEKAQVEEESVKKIEVSDMLVQQMISDYLLYNGYGKTHTALKKVTNTCNFDTTSKSNLAGEKISRTPTGDDKAERKNRRKSMSDCDSGSDTHRKLFPCPFCSFIPLANLDFVESQENYKIREIICKCCTHRYAVSVSEIEVKDGTQKGSKIPNVDDMKNADVEDKTSSTRYCEPLIRESSGDDSADVNVGNRDNRRVDRDGEIDSERRDERNSIRRFFASLLQQASSSSSGSNPPRMATDQASNARSIRQVLSHRRSADIARSHPDHDSSPFLQSVSRQVTWRDSLEQDESPMETDTNSTTLLREGERRENRNASSGGSGLGGDGRRGLTLDDTRRLRRSLVLHEHDALNDLISAAEGTPPMDTDTSNDLNNERGKGRENYASSSLLCTALPPLDVDVHSLLLSFPPPLTSLPDSVTKATSDNIARDEQFFTRALEDTLDFRTKIRRMLKAGEVENVIDELLAMDKDDMSETRQDFRETVALRSSPAWIYLNVLLFIRLLSSENKAGESDWKGDRENEGEEKDEKVLLETKDDDDDKNNMNSLERAIEIGRRELFFLIDPNRSCTNANTSAQHSGTGFGFVGSSGNGYSYRSIGAGELRGVRSESWHVWNFYSCSSDGSSSKKRARDNMDGEDSAAGNDLSNGIGSNSAQKCSTHGSIDNEPRSTLFACTSFEYQVLAKLVKDVVALLVIPPPTLRGLSQIYNARLYGSAFNIEGTGMDISPTTSNKALQGESAFSDEFHEKLFDSIPCDYFLHSNFVDLVADSVNSYVLSRCQHFSPCSTNSTNCYLSYHTALETCVAQLHCLQVSSQSKSPNPRTTTIENISARNCKGNGMKHFHLYNTHPVIWPCCHPPS